jgi:hypothetical protein
MPNSSATSRTISGPPSMFFTSSITVRTSSEAVRSLRITTFISSVRPSDIAMHRILVGVYLVLDVSRATRKFRRPRSCVGPSLHRQCTGIDSPAIGGRSLRGRFQIFTLHQFIEAFCVLTVVPGVRIERAADHRDVLKGLKAVYSELRRPFHTSAAESGQASLLPNARSLTPLNSRRARQGRCRADRA